MTGYAHRESDGDCPACIGTTFAGDHYHPNYSGWTGPREYWINGPGSVKPVFQEKEEKEEATMKSGNHFDAKETESGEWICRTCGGESFDYELFEEYGDQVGCLNLGVGKKKGEGNPKGFAAMAEVQSARKHIEGARTAMETLDGAAKGGSIPDGRTGGYWEEGDEIIERGADGSVRMTYKAAPKWVTYNDSDVEASYNDFTNQLLNAMDATTKYKPVIEKKKKRSFWRKA